MPFVTPREKYCQRLNNNTRKGEGEGRGWPGWLSVRAAFKELCVRWTIRLLLRLLTTVQGGEIITKRTNSRNFSTFLSLGENYRDFL